MLEVLDPEQNSTFSDHYIEETFDLSKVLFIATANNLASIPGPLRDRMEIISLSGYTENEKLEIVKDHLLPKQIKEHGLTKSNLQIRDQAITDIIRYYTREAGVRTLERQIAAICRKAAKAIVSEERKRITVTEKNLTISENGYSDTDRRKPKIKSGLSRGSRIRRSAEIRCQSKCHCHREKES